MCSIIDYFQTLEQRPPERMLFLVSGMLLLWLVEADENFSQLMKAPFRKP